MVAVVITSSSIVSNSGIAPIVCDGLVAGPQSKTRPRNHHVRLRTTITTLQGTAPIVCDSGTAPIVCDARVKPKRGIPRIACENQQGV